jgi:mRNA degradation ribonuclease J1/J2
MKVYSYLDLNNEQGKITTHELIINQDRFFLDFGSDSLTPNMVKDIKYIFISHEHLDHFKSLFHLAEFLKEDIEIFMTNTTKKMIELSFQKMFNESISLRNYEKKAKVLERIRLLYFNQQHEIYHDNDNYLQLTVYPSGHTFGSSMLLIESNEVNLLYTGDMDYNKAVNDRSCYFDFDKDVDYIIIDGTNILNNRKLDKVLSIAKDYAERNHIDLLIKPEKAVDIATILSKSKHLNEHKIIYKKDLYPYLEVLLESGYELFTNDKIMLELTSNMPRFDKTVNLTTRPSQGYAKKFNYTLHISLESMHHFCSSFIKSPKVLIGHYDRERFDEVMRIASDYGYHILVEGDNLL